MEYISKFCKYIDISVDVFWETAEKFRGDMWIKQSDGSWHNKIWDGFI